MAMDHRHRLNIVGGWLKDDGLFFFPWCPYEPAGTIVRDDNICRRQKCTTHQQHQASTEENGDDTSSSSSSNAFSIHPTTTSYLGYNKDNHLPGFEFTIQASVLSEMFERDVFNPPLRPN
jgi:hypothetical protein